MKESLTAFFSARLADIRRYRLRQYLLRLLLSFFLVLSGLVLCNPAPFTSVAFYSDALLLILLALTVLLTALLLLVPYDPPVSLALLFAAALYFLLTGITAADPYYALAASLVLLLFVVYTEVRPPRQDIGRIWLPLGTGLLAVGFILFVGILCCMYYRNFWTQTYDFGIFAQMFHYMKETGRCLTTCERDGLLSHFAVHFSPIYYLLLPIYCLIPRPETLLVMQAVVVASGLLPTLLLCRHHGLSRLATLSFSVLYVLYPAFLGGNFFYLHENCFLAPLLLWLLYFLERSWLWPSLGAALFLLLVKEDAAVYVAVIALYFLFAGKRKWHAATLLLLSLSWFVLVTQLMGIYGEGVMSDSRYGDYIYDGGGLITLIKAVIQNPAYAVRQMLRAEKLLFILQMLAPLAFLPLLSRRADRLILLIPFLLVNLMTSYPYQYDVGFQYVFGSGAILFYLAIGNAAALTRHRARVVLVALLCSLLVFTSGNGQRIAYLGQYAATEQLRTEMESALDLIPEDASVAATTFLVANLSGRRVIYELESTKRADECEYIVIDLRYSGIETERYESARYEIVCYKEGIIAIYKNLSPEPPK